MVGEQSGSKVTKVPIDENKIGRIGTRVGGVTGNEGICLKGRDQKIRKKSGQGKCNLKHGISEKCCFKGETSVMLVD